MTTVRSEAPAETSTAKKSLSWLGLLAIPLAAGAALIFFTALAVGLHAACPRKLVPCAERRWPKPQERFKPPELDGGVAWLNTAKPIKLKDLSGKIVLLDFWTLCCINCIHVLPDLAKLEKKYAKELVVIGVHTAKFENEKSTESIRKAILRYEVTHPVVNDANTKIWQAYGVGSWPTLVLIDPEGNFVGVAPARAITTCWTRPLPSSSRCTRTRRRSTRSR